MPPLTRDVKSEMNNPIQKISYNVPQCYLELARSAFTSLHSTTKKEEILKNYPDKMANALFALASTSLIYSYMTIEAFVNAQLYLIWKKRNSSTNDANRFNSEFPKTDNFEDLKTNKKIRERFGKRIKGVRSLILLCLREP